jgi:hypothetical protein
MSIDDTTYRSSPGVNWTRLKRLHTSPAHYAHDPGDTDTASRGMLRAVHALVLEPDVFGRDFAVCAMRRDARTKAYQEFLAEHDGKTILNEREYADASVIADAVRAYPAAARLLDHPDAQPEFILRWECSVTGQPCKGRADYLLVAGNRATLIDLKTVRSVNPREMGRDAAKMLYHGQLAHYADGVRAMYPEVEHVAQGILAVEGNAPHDVGLYMLDEAAQYAGKAFRDGLMRRLAECIESNSYPGQCPDPADLSLPSWAAGMPDFDTEPTFT